MCVARDGQQTARPSVLDIDGVLCENQIVFGGVADDVGKVSGLRLHVKKEQYLCLFDSHIYLREDSLRKQKQLRGWEQFVTHEGFHVYRAAQ